MAKATLLVVEDEPNLLLGIRDILQLDKYDVITAPNGKKALETLQDSDGVLPDLIVSDIMMPFMDGIEFLQEVRKRDEWVTIPFIFLTAKGEKQDVARGKMLGVDDYIIKPFDADELLVAVDNKLRRVADYEKAAKKTVAAVKKDILTILNHEFRTPLTSIVGYSEILKEYNTVEDMSTEELIMFLEQVYYGSDRLRRLVENFIMLVEITSGDAAKNYAYRRDTISDWNIIIDNAVKQVFSLRKITNTCRVSIPEELPPVNGDRDFIVVMIRELLHNAAKFSDPDAVVECKLEPIDGYLRIHVIDPGRGIPQHEFDNIWEPMYQIDREHFEDQGAGSGLPIVKGLADLHNAKTGLKSTLGEGSHFWIDFPIIT